MKGIDRNRIFFLEKKLRELINSWNLIPGCPNDEFDTLNNRILGVLLNNKDQTKIQGIIESYIKIDLGLYTDQQEIETKFDEVIELLKINQ